jgi:hypothetical protein
MCRQLWPKLAEWFGLDVAPPLRIPLTSFMPLHKGKWAEIVKKYDLKDIPFEKVCFPFADQSRDMLPPWRPWAI